MKILTQANFKRKYNLSQRQLNDLAKRGCVKIQQSGFKSDSNNHHKIVILEHDSIEAPKNQFRTTTSSLDRVRLMSHIWCDYCENYHDVTELKERYVGNRVNYYCPRDKQKHPYVMASLEQQRLD